MTCTISVNVSERELMSRVNCETLTRCTQCIRDLLIIRCINLHFTYLLTYLMVVLLLSILTLHLWCLLITAGDAGNKNGGTQGRFVPRTCDGKTRHSACFNS